MGVGVGVAVAVKNLGLDRQGGEQSEASRPWS